MVDPTAGTVYAFVTTNSNVRNAVYQFFTSFTTGTGTATTGTPAGKGGAGYYFYSGAFDNVYYSSASGTAGHLWVMGNTGDAAGGNLYRIKIDDTGAMAATAKNAIADLTSGHPWPSPITEFCNNGISDCGANATATTEGTHYIFFSVDSLASATGTSCVTGSGDGCVLGYDITTPETVPTAPVGGAPVATAATPGCWSTSAIEVHNSVPSGILAGASQIYFLALNGNGAGGPTEGTYTSSKCKNVDTATPRSPSE